MTGGFRFYKPCQLLQDCVRYSWARPILVLRIFSYNLSFPSMFHHIALIYRELQSCEGVKLSPIWFDIGRIGRGIAFTNVLIAYISLLTTYINRVTIYFRNAKFMVMLSK